MRAIARLCWTYGTALPVQRWVGCCALAMCALALLARATWGSPLWALAIVATAMYALATALAAGYLFRQWSTPRTHRFLPHFRARTLAAFLIVVAAISAPELAMLVPPSQSGSFGAAAPGLLLNLATLMTFAPGAATVVALLCAAFGSTAARLLASTAPAGLSGTSAAALAVALWIGAWTVFGVWYLRARNVGRLQRPYALFRWLEPRFFSNTAGDFSRDSALTTSFTAGYPPRPRDFLIALAIGLVVLMNLVAIFHRVGAPATGFLMFGVGTTFGIAPVVNRIARRTRSLWLASGLSRRALFAAAERHVWRGPVPRALAAFAVLVGVAAVAFELPPADLIGRVFAVWSASVVLGVYLGLAELRGGLHALELGVGLAYSASVALGLWAALGEPRYDWLLGITAAQLTVAAAVRALAITRWTRLDWLTFRPLRTRAQSLRAGG